jgi:penicillin-binding protein 2
MENRATSLLSAGGHGPLRRDADGPSESGGGRLVWLFVAFTVPLLAVGARLVQLQCYLADDYVAAFDTTTESLEAIPAVDGRIYAADGRVLAEDVERFNIAVHYRWLEDPPNAHWLTRQALSQLSRAERRKKTVVEAERQKVLASRDSLWARLSAVSGLSPKVLAKKRAKIQERVERIGARLAKRQEVRDNEISGEASAVDADPSPVGRLWRALAAALTTPPVREESEPIIAREALDYHPIIEDVPLDVRAQIESHPSWFPGVRVGCLSRRVYSDSAFAPHVVGVRVPVTATELGRTDPDGSGSSAFEDSLDYRSGDRIGRSGVEAAYDSHLRGLRGTRRLTRNRYGEVVREEILRAPRPGSDVELNLNVAVQRKMERLLDAALHPKADADTHTPDVQIPTGGAVVALDVESGALFVMASAPRFDFGSSGVPNPDVWKRFNDDPLQPLFHRAIQSALPPGSVFKVLSSVALLESGKLDPDERFECRGYLDRPTSFRCLIYAQQKVGHGPVDLSDALSRSCNVYFFHAVDRLGPETILDWSRRFAIGSPTGVDLPFEKSGHLPDPDVSTSQAASGKANASRWHTGDTRMLAIGQSTLTTTPLQIARMMAAIANGGNLVTPSVARRAGPRLADEDAASSLSRRVPVPGISEQTLARVRAALAKTVSDPSGTGFHSVRTPQIFIAGKSGTAQARKGKADHAWFAGYAPADSPRVAFAVVLEHAGSGSKVAGPIARQLVEALLADGVLQPQRVTLRQ